MLLLIFFVLHHQKKRKLAGKDKKYSNCNYHFPFSLSDLCAQKKSIACYLHQVQHGIESAKEPEVLKRVLALVMQAASALKSVSDPINVHPFTVKERFAPAQNNETQLQFKISSGNEGLHLACYFVI